MQTPFTTKKTTMSRDKKHYDYVFENGETHLMTPPEAYKYAYHKKCKIISGPGYENGKKPKAFTGWGWHDSLRRTFKGPNDYRSYLRAHGIEEWGDVHDAPRGGEYKPPLWDDELLRKAAQLDIYIPGRLAEALKNGEATWPEDMG